MKRSASAALACLLLSGTTIAAPGAIAAPGDWPQVGNDSGGMKFSPLTEITPANVGRLKQVWSYDTGDKAGGFRGWEVTPIVVGNIMYFPTSASAKITA